jgi:hypothetical protein
MSKREKKLLTLIQNEGNGAHNKEVLENRRGELHVARVSGDDNNQSNLCLAMSACCGSLKRS